MDPAKDQNENPAGEGQVGNESQGLSKIEPTAAAPASEELRQAVPIPERRVELLEYKINKWAFMIAPGVTLDDMLEEKYYTHIGVKLRPYDEITVHSEDGSWWAKLLVRSAGKGWAQISPLQVVRFKEEADHSDRLAAKYEVKWGGPAHKWRVMRGDTVMKKGFTSEDEARAWVARNGKARNITL